MSQKQIISWRMTAEDRLLLDEVTARHPQFNRSLILDRIIHAVLYCADESTLWKILSTAYPEDKLKVVKFETKRTSREEIMQNVINSRI